MVNIGKMIAIEIGALEMTIKFAIFEGKVIFNS